MSWNRLNYCNTNNLSDSSGITDTNFIQHPEANCQPNPYSYFHPNNCGIAITNIFTNSDSTPNNILFTNSDCYSNR
jgi:hypothetical protein